MAQKRLSYEKPKLSTYGDLKDVTHGSFPSGQEPNQGNKHPNHEYFG